MKANKDNLLLYAVTDRHWLKGEKLENQVEEIIKAGATFIQLREKNLSNEDFIAEGRKIQKITDKYNIPFVINDNIDVALRLNADGVHVGQSDMNARDCRKLIGKDKILGVSAQTVKQAVKAEKNGADYLGVGAVFSTASKDDADDVSIDTLKNICDSVRIPVIAIGGITEDNILQLKGSGIVGTAVISAIFKAKDIKKATENLLKLSKEIIK